MSFELDKTKYQHVIRTCEALQGLAGKNTLLLCKLSPSGFRIQSIDDKMHRTVLVVNFTPDFFDSFTISSDISFACVVKELFIKENRKFSKVHFKFTPALASPADGFVGQFEISYDKMITEVKVMSSEHGQSLVSAKPETNYSLTFDVQNKLFLEQLKALKDESSDEILKFTYIGTSDKRTVVGSTTFTPEAKGTPCAFFTDDNSAEEIIYEISVDLELIYKTISKVKTINKTTQIMLPQDSSRPVRLVIDKYTDYYLSPYGSA